MTEFHVMAGADAKIAHPSVRTIGTDDVIDALKSGFQDFWDRPSYLAFLCLIYPVAGLVLGSWASGNEAFPLLFPLVSGFALLGPVAAIGLYEISRRREAGLDTAWHHAFDVRKSPALPSIALIALMLLAFFVVWLLIAKLIYAATFGAEVQSSMSSFLGAVLTTNAGWQLVVIGNVVGFIFAAAALATTVIAFPLLLDRDVGALAAIQTSVRVTVKNPVAIGLWGLIVAALLVVGSIPLLVGLALVMPILGHATWHLYRKTVRFDDL